MLRGKHRVAFDVVHIESTVRVAHVRADRFTVATADLNRFRAHHLVHLAAFRELGEAERVAVGPADFHAHVVVRLDVAVSVEGTLTLEHNDQDTGVATEENFSQASKGSALKVPDAIAVASLEAALAAAQHKVANRDATLLGLVGSAARWRRNIRVLPDWQLVFTESSRRRGDVADRRAQRRGHQLARVGVATDRSDPPPAQQFRVGWIEELEGNGTLAHKLDGVDLLAEVLQDAGHSRERTGADHRDDQIERLARSKHSGEVRATLPVVHGVDNPDAELLCLGQNFGAGRLHVYVLCVVGDAGRG
mmetsp:Transcript_620/g.1871  ORF Transcript_620/g.1871 Transcript_620/m.1871 type:complete len:306 (-) Transcript_620:111-1028(-)